MKNERTHWHLPKPEFWGYLRFYLFVTVSYHCTLSFLRFSFCIEGHEFWRLAVSLPCPPPMVFSSLMPSPFSSIFLDLVVIVSSIRSSNTLLHLYSSLKVSVTGKANASTCYCTWPNNSVRLGSFVPVLPKGKPELTWAHAVSKLWASTGADSKCQPFFQYIQCFCGSWLLVSGHEYVWRENHFFRHWLLR